MIASRRITAIISSAMLILTGLVVSGCSDTSNGSHPRAISSFTGSTMGTTYTVKVVASEGADLNTLKLDVKAVLARVDSRMSTYKSDSEISRFNELGPEQWLEVSKETANVVTLGLEISQLSQGAFDMTIGPLVNLWGFGPGDVISKAPSQQQIDQQFQRIGYTQIEVREQPSGLLKHSDAHLDLSAIAKGYAVDQVAERIAQDYSAFLVEVGGELKAQGTKPDGSSWKIAIESPVVGVRDIQKIISVENIAIASSGDYRNYFEQNGVRFSHTLDPTTGKPITHRLASVTILDSSCARADALATAIMVLGEEKGLALARELNLAAFFIVRKDDAFVEFYTPEFEKFLMQ